MQLAYLNHRYIDQLTRALEGQANIPVGPVAIRWFTPCAFWALEGEPSMDGKRGRWMGAGVPPGIKNRNADQGVCS